MVVFTFQTLLKTVCSSTSNHSAHILKKIHILLVLLVGGCIGFVASGSEPTDG